ncbi:lipid II:glycine glycyltransferase FemX [Saccharicrinis fermentans]|nr:peptidoglycan bridge formation glycyltransferase FemA/FemB family protein [Saccharicrinis fermentans]
MDSAITSPQKVIYAKHLKDDFGISVVSIPNIDAHEWDAFLNKTQESSYFSTSAWWKTFKNAYVLQVRNKNRELVAGIPFRILEVIPIIGKFFKFSWCDSSVLVTDTYSQKDAYTLKKMVFLKLVSFLKKRNVIVLNVSSKSVSHDKELFLELFDSSTKCATIVNDITLSDDDLYASFKKGKRYAIRKALKNQVEVKVKEGEDAFSLIADYCHLQEKMFAHKSAYYSRIYYKSARYLKNILSHSPRSYVAIAYYQGQPVAGNIMVSHKDMIYAYLGASDNELNRATDGSSLLEFEMMKFARDKGFKQYDLVGITIEKPDKSDPLYGIYSYKIGFGGEIRQYDSCGYSIRKRRYLFVWWLRKFETNPLALKIYQAINRNHHINDNDT